MEPATIHQTSILSRYCKPTENLSPRSKSCILLYENLQCTPLQIFQILNQSLQTKKRFFTSFYSSVKDGVSRVFFTVSTLVNLRLKKSYLIFGKAPSLIDSMRDQHLVFFKDLMEPADFYDHGQKLTIPIRNDSLGQNQEESAGFMVNLGEKRGRSSRNCESQFVKKLKTQQAPEIPLHERRKVRSVPSRIEENENFSSQRSASIDYRKIEEKLFERISKKFRRDCQRTIAPVLEMLQNIYIATWCPSRVLLKKEYEYVD